ncbi:Gid12p KNAG_0B02970 [Huiozyma naganishii CBS 8797]|uniref:Uncharacterized protein n=1 Tax=Huiozyma naganishii (strain ATCC MYA-139 / BCRC 22969 / CBS 8797 / KCTC 17520 / NBRC 10181 / NCYC 3082 / Yp74L-3) TaxID=1071383 RepID=J7S3I0_HUIN7|nr:hypothetical protein KNAG_0B02970 [Kazachstania naganishii CBS 8797]CCK68739.1 hypothetical protein KNAG_0B02970 [Kazachstania naganishii CBS 8797]
MPNPIRFVVSTPCNQKGKPSGYRILELNNKRLSVVSYKKDKATDIGVTTQIFCYLKPKSRSVIPDHLNYDDVDHSDYMFVGKSNGLIEVIQDYEYKVSNTISLEPNFVLRCSPEDYSNGMFPDYVMIGLEYKDGLLYCCLSSGRIYTFILNLPEDYKQCDNLCLPDMPSTWKDQSFPSYFDPSEEIQSRETSDFLSKTEYTGRTKLKHICYYLIPIEKPKTTVPRSILYFIDLYRQQYIYRPSMLICLEDSVSGFQINPFDKLSFLTVSPRNPIMIRKVILPRTYLNYFITFSHIKKRIQEIIKQEIIPWEDVAIENGFHSFAFWMACESVYGYESISSTLWNEILENHGTGYLKSTVVWKQSHSRADDKLYESLYRMTNEQSQENIYTPTSRPQPRTTRSLQRHVLNEPVDFPQYSKWELNSFIRNVRKKSYTVDFNVISSIRHPGEIHHGTNTSTGRRTQFRHNGDEIRLRSNSSEILEGDQMLGESEQEDSEFFTEELETTTSFLTDRYKSMEIVAIDTFLILSVFRPKYQDEAILKIDSFNNQTIRTNDDYLRSSTDDEEILFDEILSRLSSFKKLFILTEYLYVVIDVNGILVVDKRKIKDTECFSKNDYGAFKVAGYNFGLVSDALFVSHSLTERRSSYNMEFVMIVTCLPGEIKAFGVVFNSDSKIGQVTPQDSLRLKKRNTFVDKLLLIDSGVAVPRKREPNDNANQVTISKRIKMRKERNGN